MSNSRRPDSREASPAAGEPGALRLLAEALPSLSEARRRVAEVVLAHPAATGRETITWLAERAATNPGTITRMTVALGYAGFQAFRAAVARDAGRDAQAGWESDIGTEIASTDSPATVLDVLARDQYRAMRSTLASLDVTAVALVADAIVAARRVQIYGEWGDAIVAQELQLRLARVGIAAWHLDGPKAAEAAVRMTMPGDVALAITRTGEDTAVARFLAKSCERGAITAVLTGAPEHESLRGAETVLFSGTPAGPFWTDYFAGRTSDSLAASLLWVLVIQRIPGALGDPGAAFSV